MDTFPPTKRLTFLLDGDARLAGFSVDSARVAFRFQNGCRVESRKSFGFRDRWGVETEYDVLSSEAAPITFNNLIGKAPKTVVSDHLTLTLTFEDGEHLRIDSELGPYECGQIDGPNGSIIF
ncbi:MAG: hypothetical protein ACOY4K_10335 [Pseudomonadota bacterium]